jgi:hypothetical protein
MSDVTGIVALTAREKEILLKIGTGANNYEIADDLQSACTPSKPTSTTSTRRST